MPKIEVEVSDDGKVGTLPEPIQKWMDAQIDQRFSKLNTELTARDKEIASLKAGGTLNPAEREKLTTLEHDQSKLREELALRDKNYEEARRIVEERHAKELQEREARLAGKDADIAKRTARIAQLTGQEIRAAALSAGARKESVEELEAILGPRIGLDDALQAFVKDAQDAGKPQLGKDGAAVTIEGLVTQYLTDHPHHRAAASGRGGGAAGGRSINGTTGASSEKEAVFEAARTNPTSQNIAAAFARLGQA